jgi:hypothetical protein
VQKKNEGKANIYANGHTNKQYHTDVVKFMYMDPAKKKFMYMNIQREPRKGRNTLKLPLPYKSTYSHMHMHQSMSTHFQSRSQ